MSIAIRSRALADEVLLALEAYSGGGVDKEELAENWSSGLLPRVYDALNLFAMLPQAPATVEVSRLAEEVRLKTLEAAASVCEKLAYTRFDDHGTREPDTGACYYGGRNSDEYEIRDEEDLDCAAAIRELATMASTASEPAARLVGGEAADVYRIALESIACEKPRHEPASKASGSPDRMRCYHCGFAWQPDNKPFHAFGCAYVEATEALAATQPPRAAAGATGEAT
jgi:hypothetical protein